jgi:ABC-type polar amino acid transport system ATPase subunit
MLPKVNVGCDSEDEDDCAQRERETEEKTHSFQHFHMFQRITTVSNPLRSPVLPKHIARHIDNNRAKSSRNTGHARSNQQLAKYRACLIQAKISGPSSLGPKFGV